MKDILKNTAFALVMLIYLGFPISKIFQQEKVLDQGTLYQFRPQPVDPYDAFRGRYIILNLEAPSFDLDSANHAFDLERDKVAYVSLGTDAEGFATYTQVHRTAPTAGDYLKMNVSYFTDSRIGLEIPENFTRYYLNEALAPLAEKKYNELLRGREEGEQPRVVLEARILDGRGVVEQLYFDDEAIESYLKNLPEESSSN